MKEITKEQYQELCKKEQELYKQLREVQKELNESYTKEEIDAYQD